MHEATPATGRQNDGLIRIGGLAVLVALALHIFVNSVLKQFPPESPSLAELQAYLSAEAGTWSIVHGLRYVALAGLVLFAAGLYARTCRIRGVTTSGWGIVGLLGSAIHVTHAMVANGVEILAFYDFGRLSEDPKLFWLVFYAARVLFTAEIAAWALVIIGFSMAAFQSSTLPKWLTTLGFFSAAACMASGAFVISILTGGWAAMLMNLATLTGLAWFASVGVYMLLRGES